MKTPKPAPEIPVEDTTLPLDGQTPDKGETGADTPEDVAPAEQASEAETSDEAAPAEQASEVDAEGGAPADADLDAAGDLLVIEDDAPQVVEDRKSALIGRLKQVVAEIDSRNTDRMRDALLDDLTRLHGAEFIADGVAMGPIFARGTGHEQQLTNWSNKARRTLLELEAI